MSKDERPSDKPRMGRPLKPTKRKRIQLGLIVSAKTKNFIDKEAKASGRSQSQVAESLIERALQYDALDLNALNKKFDVIFSSPPGAGKTSFEKFEQLFENFNALNKKFDLVNKYVLELKGDELQDPPQFKSDERLRFTDLAKILKAHRSSYSSERLIRWLLESMQENDSLRELIDNTRKALQRMIKEEPLPETTREAIQQTIKRADDVLRSTSEKRLEASSGELLETSRTS
jgi:hypothetical protein